MNPRPSFLFSDLNLRKTTGKENTTCPICSSERGKKKHRCVSVDHETGNASCNHCKNYGVRELYKSRDFTKPTYRPKRRLADAFIPMDSFNRCDNHLHSNSLYKALSNYLTDKERESRVLDKIFERYRIRRYIGGTSLFPLIDSKGRLRAVQAKGFNEQGKTRYTSYFHGMLALNDEVDGYDYGWLKKYEDNKPSSGLFGGHLLKDYNGRLVHLVEDAKTAVVASLVFKEPVVSVMSIHGLTWENCKELKGYRVKVWADVDAFQEWSDKLKSFRLFEYEMVDWMKGRKVGKKDDIADHILLKRKQELSLREMKV